MDQLSDVIRSIRVGDAHARLIRESGSWGMRFPSVAGSGFHIVLRGNGWLVSANGRPTALKPGDVVLAPSGAEHGLSHAPCALGDLPLGVIGPVPPASGPADFEFLCGAYRFTNGHAAGYFGTHPDVVAVSPDYDRHPELRSLTALFNGQVWDTRPGADASRAALIDLILVHALRQWHEHNGAADWPVVTDTAVATALREIHANPSKRWTVQELSDLVGMSRAAFTRRFAALTGKPPMTYLIGWRLANGARLLQETTAPLVTIARQVGYSTEFAFAAAFRREYGVSPGRFRRDSAVPPQTLVKDAGRP
jgi:AraC-like DNA-binding protein